MDFFNTSLYLDLVQLNDLVKRIKSVEVFINATDNQMTNIIKVIRTQNITVLQAASAQLLEMIGIIKNLVEMAQNNVNSTQNSLAGSMLSTLISNYIKDFFSSGN